MHAAGSLEQNILADTDLILFSCYYFIFHVCMYIYSNKIYSTIRIIRSFLYIYIGIIRYSDIMSTTTKDTKKNNKKVKNSAFSIMLMAAMFLLMVNPASAGLNTTSITDAIGSFSDIMPSIGDMVTSVVPTLMTLAIVGFVMRFYSQILEAISGFLKF